MKILQNLYSHGGNVYEAKGNHKGPVLDFSANINPLGIPRRIRELLSSQVKKLIHYPDPQVRRFRAAIARYWDVGEENVLTGNGSTELIYLILNTFRPAKVTLVVPSFTEYERAARLSGSKINFIHLLKDKGFRLDISGVKSCDMTVLCNPNNPTGNLLIENRAGFENISSRHIVIDEAFMDFMHNESSYNFIREAVRSKKIIVLRTLTKIFALPGLRAGYVISHRDNIRILTQYQPPWSVNVLAQVAGEYLFGEEAFMQRSRRFIERERNYLYEALARIKGLKPYPSVANFLLVKIMSKQATSARLKERLLKKGILIRDCANFRGLNEYFLRVAVRSRKENIRLIQALRESL
jgi:threonine-phosphate decarboxylase